MCPGQCVNVASYCLNNHSYPIVICKNARDRVCTNGMFPATGDVTVPFKIPIAGCRLCQAMGPGVANSVHQATEKSKDKARDEKNKADRRGAKEKATATDIANEPTHKHRWVSQPAGKREEFIQTWTDYAIKEHKQRTEERSERQANKLASRTVPAYEQILKNTIRDVWGGVAPQGFTFKKRGWGMGKDKAPALEPEQARQSPTASRESSKEPDFPWHEWIEDTPPPHAGPSSSDGRQRGDSSAGRQQVSDAAGPGATMPQGNPPRTPPSHWTRFATARGNVSGAPRQKGVLHTGSTPPQPYVSPYPPLHQVAPRAIPSREPSPGPGDKRGNSAVRTPTHQRSMELRTRSPSSGGSNPAAGHSPSILPVPKRPRAASSTSNLGATRNRTTSVSSSPLAPTSSRNTPNPASTGSDQQQGYTGKGKGRKL